MTSYRSYNKKVAHEPGRSESLMSLPHYDVYRVSINEQKAAKCYLLLYIIKGRKLAKLSFGVVRQQHFARHLT